MNESVLLKQEQNGKRSRQNRRRYRFERRDFMSPEKVVN